MLNDVLCFCVNKFGRITLKFLKSALSDSVLSRPPSIGGGEITTAGGSTIERRRREVE